MKAKLGLAIFAILLLALCGAGYLAYLHGQASHRLVAAVSRHDAPQVEALLRQGADPNVRDWKTYYEGGGEPFVPAWYEKPLARIMRRPPREGDHYIGPTALMIASYHGDLEIAKSLLAHGADVRLKGTSIDYDGDTEPVSALYEAMPMWFMEENQDKKVLSGKEAISLLLIAHGTQVNESVSGTSLLHTAAVSSKPRVVTALLDQGAKIDALDADGKTPLLKAADFARPFAENSRDAHAALILIARGADVNHQDADGNTALMLAAEYGLTDVARALLAKGANIIIRNKAGDTALKIAENNNGLSENGADDGPRTNTTVIIRILKSVGAK